MLALAKISTGWFAAACVVLLAILLVISGGEIGETSAIEVVQVPVLCAASIIWFAIGFRVNRMDRLQHRATFLPLALMVGVLAFAAMGREVNFGRIWGFDWWWIVAWKMATGLIVLVVFVAAAGLWIKGEVLKRQAISLVLQDRMTVLIVASAGLCGLADLFDKELIGGSLNVHLEESAELLAYFLLLLTAVDRFSNRWHTDRSPLWRYDLTRDTGERRRACAD